MILHYKMDWRMRLKVLTATESFHQWWCFSFIIWKREEMMKSFFFPFSSAIKLLRGNVNERKELWRCPSQRKTLLSKSFVVLLSFSRRGQNKLFMRLWVTTRNWSIFPAQTMNRRWKLCPKGKLGLFLTNFFPSRLLSHVVEVVTMRVHHRLRYISSFNNAEKLSQFKSH